MVGVLVALSHGHLSLEDVNRWLNNPSVCDHGARARCAPSYGLFLLNVEYPPHVFYSDTDPSDCKDSLSLDNEE